MTPKWDDMIRYSRRAANLLAMATIGGAAACLGPGDVTGGGEDFVPSGTIVVGTQTTIGASSDPDGYLASLNEALTQPIDANGSVSFGPVPAGTYDVRLLGVDAPCYSVTSNPTYVLLRPDSTVTAAFEINCP
jgi:hypothetical protein